MIHDVYPVYCFANLVNAGSSHGERPKLPSSLSNNNEPRSQSDPQNLRSKVLTRSPGSVVVIPLIYNINQDTRSCNATLAARNRGQVLQCHIRDIAWTVIT